MIAIGVNDAVQGDLSDDFFATWESHYDQTIRLAKQLSGGKVAVLTILPVEKNKSQGDQYFSMDKIQRLNKIIISLAKKNDILSVDQYSVFEPLYDRELPFTTDGVHLSMTSYRLMKDALQKAVIDW